MYINTVQKKQNKMGKKKQKINRLENEVRELRGDIDVMLSKDTRYSDFLNVVMKHKFRKFYEDKINSLATVGENPEELIGIIRE
jgi:hypothetical protein